MSSQLKARGPQKYDGMLSLDGLIKVTATAIVVDDCCDAHRAEFTLAIETPVASYLATAGFAGAGCARS